LGETVLAFGNPFGLSGSVTMGIVSAKGRANVGIVDYEDFIQTDAAINPGNSGGALVNLRGELVGVNTAILSRSGGYQGIGFAIPSNMADSIMAALLTDGRVARGWLGVMIQDLQAELAEAFEMGTTEGVLVGDVVPGSPALDAGVERGDVIVALDGQVVASAAALRNAVGQRTPGSKVKLKLLRDGRSRQITVRLGELPEEGAQAPIGSGLPDLGGLTVAPLDAPTRARHDVPEEVRQGVVVTDVQPFGAAARAGVRPGDVVMEVNRTPVASVEGFHAAAGEGEGVLLLVWRGGRTRWVVLD
jgi:serine protease Do